MLRGIYGRFRNECVCFVISNSEASTIYIDSEYYNLFSDILKLFIRYLIKDILHAIVIMNNY